AIGLNGICEYPRDSHGNPVNSQLRTQSERQNARGRNMSRRIFLGSAWMLRSAVMSPSGTAKMTQNNMVANTATGALIPPKLWRLT
ncbi:MAG: hypothetical protein VW683_11780, partial [Betaproteobacteria bacterium]